MTLDPRLERAVIDALHYGFTHDAFVLQPLVEEAVKWWLEGAREPWIAKLILEAVAAVRERVAVGEQPPFASPPGWPDGVIGGFTTWGGRVVRLPLATASAGILVVGEPGSRKTTLMLHQARDMARQGAGVLVTDTGKREARTLHGMLAPYGVECAVVPAEDLRLNAFDREGVQVVPFATFIADVLEYVLELRSLGAVIMYQLILDRYATGSPFTVLDLLQDWQAADRNRLATESAVERFRRFVLAMPDGVRRVRRGWSVDDLIGPGRCCVLELDALREDVQQWIVYPLIYKLFRRSVEAGR